MTALDRRGRPVAVRVVGGGDLPDLDAVDRIARWALILARRGGRLVLQDVAPELRELLDLVALGVGPDGAVEVGRQPEPGE